MREVEERENREAVKTGKRRAEGHSMRSNVVIITVLVWAIVPESSLGSIGNCSCSKTTSICRTHSFDNLGICVGRETSCDTYGYGGPERSNAMDIFEAPKPSILKLP